MRLDRYISIKYKGKTGQNAYGERTVSKSLVSNVWASKEDVGGNVGDEDEEDDREQAVEKTRFVIRYKRGITTSHFIEYDNIHYDITSVREKGRSQYLILITENRGFIDENKVLLEDGTPSRLEDGTFELFE
jgi:SPP1 family predicted phage head-tail adaptor